MIQKPRIRMKASNSNVRSLDKTQKKQSVVQVFHHRDFMYFINLIKLNLNII